MPSDTKALTETIQTWYKKTTRNRIPELGLTNTTDSTSKCGNCSSNHPPRSCPSFGRKGGNCGKYNHYATSCDSWRKTRTQETAYQLAWNYSHESEAENVHQVTATLRDRKLLATTKVKNESHIQDLEFQLDTPATCNTLNIPDYNRLGRLQQRPH